MRVAIEKAREGVGLGQTPFGAVIVGGDRLVVAAHNIVWQSTDITAHAEITAIREACRLLNTIDLHGCTIYSTCEPCPMCFAACHWARLDRIVYGASIADAASAGFNEMPVADAELKRLAGSPVAITSGVLRDQAAELFTFWKNQPQSRVY